MLGELGPYFLPAGRLAGVLSVIAPAGVVYALYLARRGAALDAPIAVAPRLRSALLAHAAYFSICPFIFESGLDVADAVMNGVPIALCGILQSKRRRLCAIPVR